ncbi:uncharacterized protein LOC126847063 [Adelges cooleyi]|uniref:uncharacterized protein LOC126847063 n=1 Tax=Adelges cooleyi TaxID=133065 RepID=UPI0021800F87|nr:uncharacterized protein LOC126847063 [Adelges cooleyi]
MEAKFLALMVCMALVSVSMAKDDSLKVDSKESMEASQTLYYGGAYRSALTLLPYGGPYRAAYSYGGLYRAAYPALPYAHFSYVPKINYQVGYAPLVNYLK